MYYNNKLTLIWTKIIVMRFSLVVLSSNSIERKSRVDSTFRVHFALLSIVSPKLLSKLLKYNQVRKEILLKT